jgi:hypothetical protein
MSISNYCEVKVLDHVLGGAAFTQPAGIYVKLHVGDPGEDCLLNAATEVTRKLVTFAAAASGAKATNSAGTWTGVAGTETYSYVSLWDAVTGGNPLWSGPMTSPVSVTAGGNFTLGSGQVNVLLD